MLIGADDVIVAGHGRVAAKQLDPTEVPVLVLDHLNEAQRRALVIADNRIAENAGCREARTQAPFPSDPHYDAKAWELCAVLKGPGRVVFWNVAGPAKP